MEEKYEKTRILGAILKAHRETRDISQKEIAERLGYRNANYISMVETNKSTIPIARIDDIIEAYELPKEFALIIIRELYPDCYRLLFTAMPISKNLGKTKEEIDKGLAKLLDKMRGNLLSETDRTPNKRAPIKKSKS